MPQSANLTKIGSRVKIDLDKVKDRISNNLIHKIFSVPRARVTDFKLTDGCGVGVLLMLADGTKNWFFESEVGRG